jgi:hypothetical protein
MSAPAPDRPSRARRRRSLRYELSASSSSSAAASPTSTDPRPGTLPPRWRAAPRRRFVGRTRRRRRAPPRPGRRAGGRPAPPPPRPALGAVEAARSATRTARGRSVTAAGGCSPRGERPPVLFLRCSTFRPTLPARATGERSCRPHRCVWDRTSKPLRMIDLSNPMIGRDAVVASGPERGGQDMTSCLQRGPKSPRRGRGCCDRRVAAAAGAVARARARARLNFGHGCHRCRSGSTFSG